MSGEPAPALAAWTVADREDFFAAIARHRRASWQVTAVTLVCAAIVALVVAVLVSPLLYAILILLLDLLNLIIATPDLFASVMQVLDRALDDSVPAEPALLLRLAVLAALPGLLLMGLVLAMLARTLRNSPLFDGGDLGARAVDPTVLAEQRFANTIAEMALAAALPAPRVRIVDAAIGNAAIFGRDDGHATVLVGRGLLDALDRAAMQGVAAHLIASMANGDLRLGLRVATTLSLFGLIGRLAEAMLTAKAWAPWVELLRLALWPNRARAAALALRLAEPFASEAATKDSRSNSLSVRDWLRMPFAGPLSMTGFFGGIVSTAALAPLIALAWRRRKYLADATAVRLTRDPDAVAAGLDALERAGHARSLAPWADHCSVVAGAARGGLLSGALISMIPPMQRRLRALGALGAALRPPATVHSPLALLVGIPVGALVAILLCVVVVLLCWVSIALSMLFTWLPLAVLSNLLRWLAS